MQGLHLFCYGISWKLCKHCFACVPAALCLLEVEVQQRLSPGELEFADEYFRTQGRHMKDTVLQHLPNNYDQLVRSFPLMLAQVKLGFKAMDGLGFR